MEYDTILFSRLLSAFLWTVILQVFPLCLYILITNIDVLHPVNWFANSASIAFSLGTWFSLMPIHGLVFAIGYVICQEHKKPANNVLTSRFKLVCSFFTKSNVLKITLYFFTGVVVSWTYLNINNFQIWVECQESTDSLCLSENSVFLVTCGAWTSLFYFIRYDILMEKHLQFPLIRQLKFLQIRYKFLNVLHECLISSFLPLMYYLPFYMWYRKPINVFFEFFLTTSVEATTLSGISCMVQIPLLANAWLICAVFYTTIKTLDLMIEIHLTEHFSFSLIKQPNSKLILLSQALGEYNIPIIQHLACYDLYILSMSHKSIRWQIFTLSQPGGHPHTWNAILEKSLKLIDDFICEIEITCKVPEPVKPESPIPRHIHMRDMTVRHEEIISGPVPLTPVCKLRNLVEHPGRPVVKEQQQQSTMDEIWMRVDGVLEKIKRNSVIDYVFGAKPDAEIRFILSKSQPLIWVIQSLSELSANALHEDQFGIVLKDLPVIISTLLRLKSSLDKLGNMQNKFQRIDHDLCMKTSLKSALRRSLYRIAIAYSEYLTDLPLSMENLNSMKNFVNFKEC